MLLIMLIVGLSVLRFFEIGPFAELSWWWIAALFAAAFIWFEYIEKMLGRDKRRAHDESEAARQKRVASTFKKK
ncbi:MAG: TIGR04438 family Trp-rich protein [Oxalobacteraceae bacterium]|jgi:small Trp-rich protein|nr:MAG: TIGR04438 family Trp-rich protein [Oxalobacteraceae bacterium]